MEWSDLSEFGTVGPAIPKFAFSQAGTWNVAQPPSELDHLLEVDGPSIVECFNALELAKQALFEAAAEERPVSSQSPAAVEHAGKDAGPGVRAH